MSARPPAPRPKRAGEAFARTHHLDSDGPSSSKKPRFDVRNPSALAPDAPEEDAILELDEIGKGGQQTKRNAVNLDGYESDSSNEGFDARADAKAEQAKREKKRSEKTADEDQHDMFADLEEIQDGDEDEELTREGKKKRKDVHFLGETEIEGQVLSSKAGGHVSSNFDPSDPGQAANRGQDESSSDEEEPPEGAVPPTAHIDEEIGAGGLKAHAPKLDAFNMREEMEEGRFDAQLNFVRKAADPDAIHDSWLEGVSKSDMKRAKEAAAKRDEERRARNVANDQVLSADMLGDLIKRMEKGETVLEALARLGRGKEKKKPRWQDKRKRKKGDEEMDVDAEKEPEDPAELRRRNAVETITEAADQLLRRGQPEIYDDSRELLMRQYARETGEDWVDPPVEEVAEENGENDGEAMQWEYRWTDKRDGGARHGPYDGAMMVQWQDAGFFGDGVEFRRVGDEGEWSRLVDFV